MSNYITIIDDDVELTDLIKLCIGQRTIIKHESWR